MIYGRGHRARFDIRTFLSLLHLEGEVECSDGEVDGLRVGLSHGTQQVQDVAPFLANQAGE